jgi:hypothetical protein
MRTRLVSSFLFAVSLAIVLAPIGLPVEAAQVLQIVEAGPDLYCLFSSECTVTRTNTQAMFALEDTAGYGVLHTSTFKAAPGSPADGWWGYEYQIDLGGVESILALNCIDAMRLPVGGASVLFDLDGNGTPGEQVYLVGDGAPGPTFALRDHADVTFFFDPPVCAGQASVTIGVVVARPPHGVLADLQPEQGIVVQVGVRAPEYGQTVLFNKFTGFYMVVAVLPPGSISAPPKDQEARRQVMLDQIGEALALTELGNTQAALRILESLRTRMDGVGQDWVQGDKREHALVVLDDLIDALRGTS